MTVKQILDMLRILLLLNDNSILHCELELWGQGRKVYPNSSADCKVTKNDSDIALWKKKRVYPPLIQNVHLKYTRA